VSESIVAERRAVRARTQRTDLLGGGTVAEALLAVLHAGDLRVLGAYAGLGQLLQLAFGNTRAAFINVSKAAVRWLTPPQHYASSSFSLRGFCPNCGTPLEYDEVDIGVGTLRGNPGCPECHWVPPARVCGRCKHPWHPADECCENCGWEFTEVPHE